MKYLIFYALFIIAVLSYSLNAQTFQWAKRIGGAYDESGQSIALDAYGNIYTTGKYQKTVDFDPGPGTFTLTAIGVHDIFISKLDASGNFLWAKSIGGPNFNLGLFIAVDPAGNVYTTGYFQGTADFDPRPGTYTLTSSIAKQVFLSKLDASGNFLWAKSWGSTAQDEGYALAFDNAGNVYTTGYFQGTADFDPGPGTFTLTAAGEDIFISKLSASGNFIWAKNMGGASEVGSSIEFDLAGNIYITGYFQGTADLDPGPGVFNLTSVGYQDIYVLKLDLYGNFAWAKSIGGSYSDQGLSLALDASGNVYTTGIFQNTVDFDPGPGTYSLSSAGGLDIFISKLSPAGNFIWAKRIGDIYNDYSYAIKIDGMGNIYTTGSFRGIVDFDPSAQGTFNLIAGASTQIFISKIDASGTFIWAGNLDGSPGGGVGNSIALDAPGNVYMTGTFSGNVDFDPGVGTYNLISDGYGDLFVLKLGILTTGIIEENIKGGLTFYPNPTCDFINIRGSDIKTTEIKILNILGQCVYSKQCPLREELNEPIDLSGLCKGIYFIEVNTDKGKEVKKVVLE